jgi:hypothetical protein
MFKSKKRKTKPDGRTTAVSFSAKDLTALGRLLATGQVVLHGHGPVPSVVARLKAAMTRLGVPVPRGLEPADRRRPPAGRGRIRRSFCAWVRRDLGLGLASPGQLRPGGDGCRTDVPGHLAADHTRACAILAARVVPPRLVRLGRRSRAGRGHPDRASHLDKTVSIM